MATVLKLRRLGCLTAFSAVASLPVAAQNAAPDASSGNSQQSAYRSSVAEESVRKQTDKIEAEINELVAELKLNGLDNADLTILSGASSHLKNLSQEDMQKVINALQSASMAAKDQDRQKSLVSAYKDQQSVSLQLKSLAADLAAQQSQKEIPSKLENLIARQSANIRETDTLGSIAPDKLSATLKSTHEVVSAEQTAIGGEIDLLGKVLAAKPDAPPADGAPDISKSVLDALNSGAIKDASASATQLTSAGPFPDAVTQQRAVRDALTSLLRVALSDVDAVSRLQDIKAQLAQILSDQQDLGGVTQQARLDGSTLAERQARIEDRTSVSNALLKSVNQAASGQLDQTQTAMSQSSDALAKAKNPADTASQQQEVVDDLKKTEALLDQQIAAAQKQESMSPADKLATLQKLRSQIDNAQKNPQTSASDLQKMQQGAAALSPQASDKIADAADQLQKPPPDQAAANQALAQASAIVQQQEKGIAQAAQAYQALANASQQLNQAQQNAAAADQSLQNNAASKNFTEAAHDLTQAQTALTQAQQAAQQAAQQQAAAQQNSQPGSQQASQQGSQQSSQQASQQNSQQGSQQASQQGSQQASQQNSQQGSQQASQQGSQQASQQNSQQGSQQASQQGQGQGQGQGTQQALQQASDALKAATTQAVQAQGQNAQAQDQQAMAAMQKAQDGLAQAMAQIQQQSQGQGQGQGQGQSQSQLAQSGQGQGQGKGKGQKQQGQGGAGESPEGDSNNVLAGIGGDGTAQVMGGLKPKDRDAITQYQAEKSPPEYAPMVQQYLKNLADSSQAESH